jgi:NADH-quinone oxidoreductase subunit H
VSALTPVAILALALAGALSIACLEQAVGGAAAGPRELVRRARRQVDAPLSTPRHHDAWLFHLAPPLLLIASVVALAMVPWAPGFRGVELSTGVILFAGALAFVTPAVFMAGWSGGRPLVVLGGFRFVALMLAYAMPLAMALTAVAAPAESLQPAAIVDVQHAVPTALVQPLAFALWVPSAMAVALMAPFDLANAPEELEGGAFGQYGGIHAGMVALARRILVLALAGMTAALFLSGWHGPLLAPAIWMALKTLAVAAGMLWVGRLFPRVELDRLLSVAWKFAIPAAIGAIAWSGLVTLLFYV